MTEQTDYQIRQRELDEMTFARRRQALTVKCPKCKAPAGVPCTWGVTHSGGEAPASHTPRYRKAGV